MGQTLGCCFSGEAEHDDKPATAKMRRQTMSMNNDGYAPLMRNVVEHPTTADDIVKLTHQRATTIAYVPTRGHVRNASLDTIDLEVLYDAENNVDNNVPWSESDDLLPLLSLKRPPALLLSPSVSWEARSFDKCSSVGDDDDVRDHSTSNQDDTPASYTVTVTRFFPIEDKFEFHVTVFDAAGDRKLKLIRDHVRCERYHGYLEDTAARHRVPCPVLPRTQKQDRTHGRQLMEIYIAAVLASPVLRDATCSLKYFHVLPLTKPKTSPSAKRNPSEKRQPWRNYVHSPSHK